MNKWEIGVLLKFLFTPSPLFSRVVSWCSLHTEGPDPSPFEWGLDEVPCFWPTDHGGDDRDLWDEITKGTVALAQLCLRQLIWGGPTVTCEDPQVPWRCAHGEEWRHPASRDPSRKYNLDSSLQMMQPHLCGTLSQRHADPPLLGSCHSDIMWSKQVLLQLLN